jgi:hypothetical protein
VNSGVVVARLGHEVLDGSLGRIHCDLKLFGVDGWSSECCNRLIDVFECK